MGKDSWQWIGDMFNDRTIQFHDGTIWQLGRKLSEAAQHRYHPSEARAVYVSTQVTGPQVGAQAIVKVRMQWVFPVSLPSNPQLTLLRIPNSERPHPDPVERAKDASEKWNADTEEEIEALETLTKAGCAAAPKLLSWTQGQQDNTMWVPGGYIVYILMEKLPGAPPVDFWVEGRYSLEERNEIRAAFRKALR